MEVLRHGSAERGNDPQRQSGDWKRIGEALISTHGEGADRQSDDEQRQSEEQIGKG